MAYFQSIHQSGVDSDDDFDFPFSPNAAYEVPGPGSNSVDADEYDDYDDDGYDPKDELSILQPQCVYSAQKENADFDHDYTNTQHYDDEEEGDFDDDFSNQSFDELSYLLGQEQNFPVLVTDDNEKVTLKKDKPKTAKTAKINAKTTKNAFNTSKCNNYIDFGIMCTEKVSADYNDNLCNVICSSKAELNRHLLADHQVLPYVCVLKGCKAAFAEFSELIIHQNTNHKGLSKWICCKCRRIWDSSHRLEKHFTASHVQRLYRCRVPFCEAAEKGLNIVFSSYPEVITHFRSYHHTLITSKNDDQISSDKSKIKSYFGGKGKVSEHLEHPSGQKCRVKGPRNFCCTYPGCGKSFTSRTFLNTHELYHKDRKPYRCGWPSCCNAPWGGYKSAERANVIRHIRLVHLKQSQSKKNKKNAKSKEDEEEEKKIVGDPKQWLLIDEDQF